MRKHLLSIPAALIICIVLHSQNNYNEVSLPQLMEKTRRVTRVILFWMYAVRVNM